MQVRLLTRYFAKGSLSRGMESFCYFKVDANMDVRQGTQKCQQLGPALLVIKKAEENEFLSQLIADHGDTWLGIECHYYSCSYEWRIILLNGMQVSLTESGMTNVRTSFLKKVRKDSGIAITVKFSCLTLFVTSRNKALNSQPSLGKICKI